jgi:hypothetical protein
MAVALTLVRTGAAVMKEAIAGVRYFVAKTVRVAAIVSAKAVPLRNNT